MAVKISKAKHKHIKINIVCFNIAKHFYSDLMQLDIAAISSAAFELVMDRPKNQLWPPNSSNTYKCPNLMTPLNSAQNSDVVHPWKCIYVKYSYRFRGHYSFYNISFLSRHSSLARRYLRFQFSKCFTKKHWKCEIQDNSLLKMNRKNKYHKRWYVRPSKK